MFKLLLDLFKAPIPTYLQKWLLYYKVEFVF